jgi:hypothetical protein
MRTLTALGLVLIVWFGCQRVAAAQSSSGTVGAGALAFGCSYAPTFVVALGFNALAGGSGHEADLLFLPVFGPFGFMARQGEWSTLLAVDGAVQALGLGLIVYGANHPSQEVRASPLSLRDGGGLLLSGTF